MHFYFAYGSNMSSRQMSQRCPGARPVGSAQLRNWRFHVTTRGSASILPHDGGVVHGVIWRCAPGHFHMLDKYEGVAWRNYRRRHVRVDLACGAAATAITYVGTRIYPGRARVSYMATAVLPGAQAFGLPASYIEELRSWLPHRAIGERRMPYRGGVRPIRFPR
ncbi:MAG TPA: gamma-glutamylcyclotransferase [Rhizobiales bacterium]|nr:gamma-glutamylcyclotransferase [Hyphomicrobiales bacterium]